MRNDPKTQSGPLAGTADPSSPKLTVQELPDGSGNDAPKPLDAGDENRFDAG